MAIVGGTAKKLNAAVMGDVSEEAKGRRGRLEQGLLRGAREEGRQPRHPQSPKWEVRQLREMARADTGPTSIRNPFRT